MALHLAARRRLEFEGGEVSDSGSSISAVAARGVRETRFNPAQYLQGHGWQGHGIPLDGHKGKGLKKPLAIPQKRDNKGLGGNRDRAVEWWDCLFEASAKALASGQSSASTSLAPSGTSTPNGNKLSLQGLAKREQARRQLMSNFRRGATIQMGPTPEELAREKEAERAGTIKSEKGKTSKSGKSKSLKKEKKLAKAAKKEAKERKRADKAAKKARRAEKDARRAAKKEKKAAREAKKEKKHQKEVRRAAKASSKSSKPVDKDQ